MIYYYDSLRARWRDWPVRIGVKVIEEETAPVIPLDICRQHLEIVPIDGDSESESHPDDALILGCLDAAVDYAEDVTGLSLRERVLEMALDTFPACGGEIAILRPPLIEILSFTGADGSEGEMDSGDDYILDNYRKRAVLLPVSSWPSVTRTTNQIKIRYRAGYRHERPVEEDSDGITSDALNQTDEPLAVPLPGSIRMALLLLLAHFFENRSESVEKAVSSIPLGVAMLLGPKSVETGFA